MSIIELAKRIAQGNHLTRLEYLQLAEEAPLETIQQLADGLRRRLHPDNIVTYVVDRNINYSNICTAVCTFCAFYRKPGSREGYVLRFEEIYKKVEETSN
jgi:cyclic dehypoxanthinyl futalosine synthase